MPQTLDMQRPAMALLKTMLLLDNSYGGDYLIRVLRGEEEMLKKEQHAELETFGELAEMYPERLRGLLIELEKRGFIKVKNADQGVLKVSAEGLNWMQSPQAIQIDPGSLQLTPEARMLNGLLKRLRTDLAEAEGLQVWQVFSNHTLLHLLYERPANEDALRNVPGFGYAKLKKYGAQVLAAIRRLQEQPNEVSQEYYAALAVCQPYQETRRLLDSGLAIDEVAAAQKIGAQAVCNRLEVMHREGLLDLGAWLEKQLGAAEAQLAIAYFEAHSEATLTEARQELGLNFDLLQIARFVSRQLPQKKAA